MPYALEIGTGLVLALQRAGAAGAQEDRDQNEVGMHGNLLLHRTPTAQNMFRNIVLSMKFVPMNPGTKKLQNRLKLSENRCMINVFQIIEIILNRVNKARNYLIVES